MTKSQGYKSLNFIEGPVTPAFFLNTIRFDNWQMEDIDKKYDSRITISYAGDAEDGMPYHKATPTYEIYLDGKQIGGSYGRRLGRLVYNTESGSNRNDPGFPGYFYYTLRPSRSDLVSIKYSTSYHAHYRETDYDWGDSIGEAWFPTFDTMKELLESYEEHVSENEQNR